MATLSKGKYLEVHDLDSIVTTVSDTFNGKSVPTTVTLILIVEGMGYKLSDFALIYESIKEIEIKEFKKSKKQN